MQELRVLLVTVAVRVLVRSQTVYFFSAASQSSINPSG
jgi:hypothetical protein